jgi:hypothetical protein
MMHLSQKILDSDRIFKEIRLQQERIWKESLILVETRGFIQSREIVISPEGEKPVFIPHYRPGVNENPTLCFTSFFSIRLGGISEDNGMESLLSDLDSLGFQRFTNFTFRYDYTLKITEISDDNLVDYKIFLLLVIDETIVKDKIETNYRDNLQISFIVRRMDVLDIYQESEVRDRVINKFYSEVREYFTTKILSVLSA